MCRPCIDVRDYGAVGDGTTDNFLAITNAVAAAKLAQLPLYFPAGTYAAQFTRAFDHASGEGRWLLDYPNAEIFGDGPALSVIKAQSVKATRGRRQALADDTVASGQRHASTPLNGNE